MEVTRRWKDFPCSWIGRINIMKMAMSIKIPMSFFTQIENSVLKFIWKKKDPEYQKQS
jgi:hypothetical protein